MSQNGSASAGMGDNKEGSTPAPTSYTAGASTPKAQKAPKIVKSKWALPIPDGVDPKLWNRKFSAADSQIYMRHKKNAAMSKLARESGETRKLALVLLEKHNAQLSNFQNSAPPPSTTTTSSSTNQNSKHLVQAHKQDRPDLIVSQGELKPYLSTQDPQTVGAVFTLTSSDLSTSRDETPGSSSDPSSQNNTMAGKGGKNSKKGNASSSKKAAKPTAGLTDESTTNGPSKQHVKQADDMRGGSRTTTSGPSKQPENLAGSPFGPSSVAPSQPSEKRQPYPVDFSVPASGNSNTPPWGPPNHPTSRDQDLSDDEKSDIDPMSMGSSQQETRAEYLCRHVGGINSKMPANGFYNRGEGHNKEEQEGVSKQIEKLDMSEKKFPNPPQKRSNSHFSAPSSRAASPTGMQPDQSAKASAKKPKKANKKQKNQSITESPVEDTPSSASATPAPVPAPKPKRKGRRGPRSPDDSISEDTDNEQYCICNGPDDGRMMVACDVCDAWFHFACVKISEEDALLVDRYVCAVCALKQPQKTSYKVMCRLGGCREPANVAARSKYCSDNHRLEWATRILAKVPEGNGPSNGGELHMGEVKAMFAYTKGKPGAFKRLGSKPVLPAGHGPVDFSTVLTTEEKNRVVQIHIEEEELRGQRRGYVEKEAVVRMAATRLSNNMKNGGEEMKGLCGWDPRLAMNEQEFSRWCGTPVGSQAMETKILPEDGCERKRCPKHQGWLKASIQDIRNDILQIDRGLKKLNVEEHAMRDRAEQRLIIELDKKK